MHCKLLSLSQNGARLSHGAVGGGGCCGPEDRYIQTEVANYIPGKGLGPSSVGREDVGPLSNKMISEIITIPRISTPL